MFHGKLNSTEGENVSLNGCWVKHQTHHKPELDKWKKMNGWTDGRVDGSWIDGWVMDDDG